jgi:Protein kinase domain
VLPVSDDCIRFREPTILDAMRGSAATKLVARGRSGLRYRATVPGTVVEVAVKRYDARLRTASFVVRLAAAGRAYARLAHPAIASLVAVSPRDGRAAVQWIDGTDLTRHHTMTAAAACRVVREIATALAYAHEASVAHLGLSPRKVRIMRGGGIRVVDFAIACLRFSDPDWALLPHDELQYVAPERFGRVAAHPTADVYALGMIARSLGADRAGAAWQSLVERCVEIDPQRRFADAAALLRAIPVRGATSAVLVAARDPAPQFTVHLPRPAPAVPVERRAVIARLGSSAERRPPVIIERRREPRPPIQLPARVPSPVVYPVKPTRGWLPWALLVVVTGALVGIAIIALASVP